MRNLTMNAFTNFNANCLVDFANEPSNLNIRDIKKSSDLTQFTQ